MKYLLSASSIALGLALQPALAQQQNSAKPQQVHQRETIHAPTNRIGEMVPTMTAEPSKDAATAAKDADGTHQAETVHAPTNRIGKLVPTMRSAENKDDQKKSKTYYYGDDQKPAQGQSAD